MANTYVELIIKIVQSQFGWLRFAVLRKFGRKSHRKSVCDFTRSLLAIWAYINARIAVVYQYHYLLRTDYSTISLYNTKFQDNLADWHLQWTIYINLTGATMNRYYLVWMLLAVSDVVRSKQNSQKTIIGEHWLISSAFIHKCYTEVPILLRNYIKKSTTNIRSTVSDITEIIQVYIVIIFYYKFIWQNDNKRWKV